MSRKEGLLPWALWVPTGPRWEGRERGSGPVVGSQEPSLVGSVAISFTLEVSKPAMDFWEGAGGGFLRAWWLGLGPERGWSFLWPPAAGRFSPS